MTKNVNDFNGCTQMHFKMVVFESIVTRCLSILFLIRGLCTIKYVVIRFSYPINPNHLDSFFTELLGKQRAFSCENQQSDVYFQNIGTITKHNGPRPIGRRSPENICMKMPNLPKDIIIRRVLAAKSGILITSLENPLQTLFRASEATTSSSSLGSAVV